MSSEPEVLPNDQLPRGINPEAALAATEARFDHLRNMGISIAADHHDALEHQRSAMLLDPSWVDIDALVDLDRALAEAEVAAHPASGEVPLPVEAPAANPILTARPHIVELFNSPEGEAYADILVDGVRRIYAIESKTFGDWLAGNFYRVTRRPASDHALSAAKQTLRAEATFDGDVHEVALRVAEHDGVYYIDLATEDRRVIRVAAGSWSLVQDYPVKFRRTAAMKALPIPRGGGTVDEIWKYVNVTAEQRPLVLAWLLTTLTPDGPYPILVLKGEQGTAKTTTARFLKQLTDPTKALVRSIPTNERDLGQAASNSHVLVFDNLSRLTPDMSDALCRLSTGGGVSLRKLYTDNEELVLEFRRPVMLTGITDVIARPDLADRSYYAELPVILASERVTERELEDAFEVDAPLIFGALLDALAAALDELDEVELDDPPRLADAARLAVAASDSLGFSQEAMVAALADSRDRLDATQTDASAVVRHVVAVTAEADYMGTATQLLDVVRKRATFDELREPAFPRSPRALTGELDRQAPVLRRMGIELSRQRSPGSNSQRFILLRRSDRISAGHAAASSGTPQPQAGSPVATEPTDATTSSNATEATEATETTEATEYATTEEPSLRIRW